MRLEMSKRTDLALRALTYLDSDGVATGKEVAEALDTSLNYLPQVLKPLVEEGFICSTPGPGGGYRLCTDLDDVSLLKLIEVMEGPTEQQRCVLGGAPCPSPEKCAMHDSWQKARDALLAELESTSVSATIGIGLLTEGE